MQDEQIVELFIKHDETALSECKQKYDRYLKKIAYNFLGDLGDCEECLNDVYFGAWQSVPSQNPSDLRSYLVMLTRRTSIDLLRKKSRTKRIASEYTVSLEELDECVTDRSTPEQDVDQKLLATAVNSWLGTLSYEQRNAFIARYYYSDPVRDIADCLGVSQSKIKSMLYRMRHKLKTYLEKEAII